MRATKTQEHQLFMKAAIKATLLLILLFLLSCSERFVVVSNRNALHIRTGMIYDLNPDSTLKFYQKIKLKDKTFKELVREREGRREENNTPLSR